jgi:hypothetical protein
VGDDLHAFVVNYPVTHHFMAPELQAETKAQKLRKIFLHEMFEYVLNFIFLAIFLVAFAWYRRLLLASYHIEYLGYWTPLVEAAILAKVIMIGDVLRLGREFQNRPLIVTTVYRTIVFSLLVVGFAIVEHVIGAMLHGHPASEGLAEIAGKGAPQIAAWCVMMMAAFLPFFAIKEIERVIGVERVRGLFFHGLATDDDHGSRDNPDVAK